MSGKQGHAPLEETVASQLLDRLSEDDDFRASFSRDPISALASLGHAPAQQLQRSPSLSDGTDTGAFGCMQTSQLASKEEFAAARDQLHAHLTSTGNHTVVFAFEANRVGRGLSSE